MGLDSIWNENHDWLTPRSKGFHARSTGCSCCSVELKTEAAVREEAITSLAYIIRAADFFKWDMKKLLKDGREKVRNQPAELEALMKLEK